MNKSIIPVTRVLEDSFVYSCTFDQQRGNEQFVPHHVLSFQISGETRIQHQNGLLILKENQILLTRKNQLVKTLKIPAKDKEYKVISVIITTTALQQYAEDNSIHESKNYTGEKNLLLKPDTLLKSYFQSLLPYVEQSQKISKKLAGIKTNESIELLQRQNPSLSTFLFDFSEPYKIDIEKYMLQNYHYNAPIENFAKLTGRSLAAFKRDFVKSFKVPPAKWLKEKRLEEAHYLIHQKNKKPSNIYLDLGFENLSHFYTSFKKKYGVTPAESLIINQ
ncbi:AraC family transcriptional regulator [Pedobacter frigiditerrae]|uniref:AraC family transcriptional regulator n=1 Tax=Pedobacter frigiditerrae TaxID=2530452 RepID=A0A4R0MNW6_9SPHI|nr:AraC family transcriptional regulator [Pedobacter frigiditerrae]TCC87922.1 AraC family transcriptional regulator [Pedobacter frigiditerrae]